MVTFRTRTTGQQLPAETFAEAIENLQGAWYWLGQSVLAWWRS